MILAPNFNGNIQVFYLTSALSIFFLFQKIITYENKNYISVFIITLGLLLYEVYQRRQFIHSEIFLKKEDFIDDLLEKTKQQDVQEGTTIKKYKLASALLSSERVLWSALQNFKKYAVNEENAYNHILILIVRYYEIYGNYLKNKNKEYSANVNIHDMLMKRQEIMNAIQEMHLQMHINDKMNKVFEGFSIVVLACLDKCIRVLRKKYKMFHESAPYAFNLMGDELQLY